MKTKRIAINGIGVALYCVCAMSLRVPLVGHIAVDLGYIVLAVYAYLFGAVSGAVVGGLGAAIVSVLTGWFAPGWVLGNIYIGFVVGKNCFRIPQGYWKVTNGFIAIFAVFVGIAVIKTNVECLLYAIPYAVKLAKNMVAFAADSIAMCIGLEIAYTLMKRSQSPILSETFRNCPA